MPCHVAKKPAEAKLPVIETCLSPYVHKLIVESTESRNRDDKVLNDNRLLDFTYISSQLPEESNVDSAGYFTECVAVMAPMFHSVEVAIEGTKDNLADVYGQYLEWTGQKQALLELWELTRSNDDINDLTVLLVTAAVLERSLGDVFLMSGTEPCPSMLKDLLVSHQLRDILGSDVLQILRILIGPPTSLNIRNVTWHGFPFPGEIPRRCLWFLMMLVPSIGQVLQNKNVSIIPHREPVVFPDVKPVTDVHLLGNSSDFDWSVIVAKSKFVSWNTEYFWNKVQEFYKQQRYSYCAALLLYFLEQGLRLVFATVNKCEDRILTAEATTLYTTFDEILDCDLPDKSENKLRACVSDKIVEILLDHLTYPAGPRVRDRLSHGEASWTVFPQQLTDNLASIAVALPLKFVPQKSQDYVKGVCLRILQDIDGYKVQFHRISVLKRSISECSSSTTNIDNCVKVQPDLSERDSSEEYCVSDVHQEICDRLQKSCSEPLHDWKSIHIPDHPLQSLNYLQCKAFFSCLNDILSHHIETLYRVKTTPVSEIQTWDPEGEILSHMEHVIAECHTILSHIEQFATLRQQQLEQKQLRSRQRENFKKFLSSFASYVTVTNMCCYLCCWQIFHLDDIKQQSESSNKSKIRFWKTCLQFCENLRTYSHQDKNKWSEGLDLIRKFTHTLEKAIPQQLVAKANG